MNPSLGLTLRTALKTAYRRARESSPLVLRSRADRQTEVRAHICGGYISYQTRTTA